MIEEENIQKDFKGDIKMPKKRRKIKRYARGIITVIDEPTIEAYIEDIFKPEKRAGKFIRKRKK